MQQLRVGLALLTAGTHKSSVALAMHGGKGLRFNQLVRSSSRQVPYLPGSAVPTSTSIHSRSVHIRTILRTFRFTTCPVASAAVDGSGPLESRPAADLTDSTSRRRRTTRTKQNASESPASHEERSLVATATRPAHPAAEEGEGITTVPPVQPAGTGVETVAAAADTIESESPAAETPPAAAAAKRPARTRQKTPSNSDNHHTATTSKGSKPMLGPHRAVQQSLPHVLILHTGGTLGMDVKESFEKDPEDPVQVHLKKGTGGSYKGRYLEW